MNGLGIANNSAYFQRKGLYSEHPIYYYIICPNDLPFDFNYYDQLFLITSSPMNPVDSYLGEISISEEQRAKLKKNGGSINRL